ncbi:MAG: type IX secretion system membrane protein PorP/SprF [Bacteroidia bacterium]|nr:type IX secretion system membrane protein PorP/SprF [Bacteroidia bacterium]
MKKKLIQIFLFAISIMCVRAQQYPFMTQYRGHLYFFNPAFSGTKKWIDARAFYRQQWTGFSGSPTTSAVSFNIRYFKGKMGSGFMIFNDKIGPFVNNYFSGNIAYHIKMPDTELSFGFSMAYTIFQINPALITLRHQLDASVDVNSNAINQKKLEGTFGVLYYNDRFFLSLSMLNLFGATYKFKYSNPDFFKGNYTNENQIAFGAGYNFGENPDYVFENTFWVMSGKAMPLFLDYSLRIHMHKTLIVGFSIRPGNALAFHAGLTLFGQFQITYSYDLLVSKLRTSQKGTHEINLVFSIDKKTTQKKGGVHSKFIKQKYQYLLN